MVMLPGMNLGIYGTTLWSKIENAERSRVQFQIADYQYIPGLMTGKSDGLFEKMYLV